MATPICEDEGVLQEWAPEIRLLNKIPLKAQKGIFSHNLKLQCLDAVPEFIALGTNCGLVYWYCRKTARLDRLRIENTNCSVTCVKIVSTVDFMVAAGSDNGNVTIFQIPKQHPETLPEALCPKNKQVERFTIDGLHKAPITCLEWSQNGMRLFSGDKVGCVVFTSIDFEMHLSKSVDLLNEQFEVVQLSYHQQMLLVSTIYRTVICDENVNWKVTQLGTKERKILGKFGAIFCKFEHGTVVYASRPGRRLWLADRSGSVEQTLIFQSAVQATHPKIPIINPVTKTESFDTNFGKLLQFGDNRLVCYQTEVLYVLHPGAITVIGSLTGARKIVDVAVNRDEIFILEGDRSLIRVGYAPDPYAMDFTEDDSGKRRSFILDKLKDSAVESLKRITSDLLPQNNADEISPPALADEALNLPPIIGLPKGIPNLVPEYDVEIHESIDGAYGGKSNSFIGSFSQYDSPAHSLNKNYEFDEPAIFRPGKRRKPKRHFLQLQGPESESDTTSTASEDRLVSGVANELSVSEESPTSWSQSQSSFSVLKDIHSLLHTQSKTPPKTPEDKSQASIDTCESASEHMFLAPDVFQEEQEKTFIRLANQEISMFDSYNSERTENMSISVNLTPSSSASSKLSDNLQSSELSENVSMISDNGTSCESQNDFAAVNDSAIAHHPPNSSSCLPPSAETSSVSSGNSQNIPVNQTNRDNESGDQILKDKSEDLWSKEMILSQMLGLDLDDPLNRRKEQDHSGDIESSSIATFEASVGDCTASDCKTPLVDQNGIVKEDRSLLPESDQELEASESCLQEGQIKTEENNATDQKLASLGSLSYGPPSGSSMLSSCYPSLEVCTGPAAFNNPQGLLVEKSDLWLQYKTPPNLSFLAVSNNYVVCTNVDGTTFYSELSGLSLSWSCLDYKCFSVAPSLDGKLVWALEKSGVIAFVNPSLKGPFADEKLEVASNVRAIAVDKCTGYFVQPDGRIFYQMNLSRFPRGPSENIPCDWLVKDIACRNGVVAAITSNEDVIVRNPTNLEFGLIPTPGESIASISFGPANSLWIVDDRNNIYFSVDFLTNNPHWWQVLISQYIFRDSPSMFLNMHERVFMDSMGIVLKQVCIAANDSSVWAYSKYGAAVHVNKHDFIGYIWYDIDLPVFMKWATMSVEGVFEDKGHIWLLSCGGDIFSSKPSSPHNMKSIASPTNSEITCIACAPNTLWILCADGSIFARKGLSDDNQIGTGWKELRLFEQSNIHLNWLACGCDVVWGVGRGGRFYITSAAPHDITTNVLEPVWIEIDGEPKAGCEFIKVFVGPQMHMVWALDNNRKVYVREGIFPNHMMGTGWVSVDGVKAVHLSVSSTAVWALSPTGAVYRRHGINQNNYIGDYWRKVPGTMAAISTSFTDEVWGFTSTGGGRKLLKKHVVINNNSDIKNVSISDCSDWEVV